MSGGRFYSEEEVDQILRLATRQSQGGIDKRRLLEMASELGISPEALEAAEKQVQAENLERQYRAEFEKQQLRDLWNHIGGYIIVNAGLMILNYFQAGRITWAWWPLIGWGIGIAHGVWEAIAKGSEDHEEEFEKWKAKKGLVQKNPETLSGYLENQIESMLLRENLSKLEAIRKLREETGSTLKDAREAVEAYERLHPGDLRG